MPNAKKVKQAARSERVAALRAQQKRAERRRNLITIGVIAAAAAVIIGVVAWYAASRGNNAAPAAEVLPPGVSGTTTGWPQASHNGPAAQALAHDHVPGPVTYSVTPPVGGQHNATWMNWGIYDKPVLNERGATWSTARSGSPTGPRCRNRR